MTTMAFVGSEEEREVNLNERSNYLIKFTKVNLII